jgi:hypothetical protein
MAERYVEEAVSVAPTCLNHKRMILMFAQMLLHLQAQATKQVSSYTTFKAAHAQIRGFAHLESLNITHYTPSLPSMSRSQTTTPSVSSRPPTPLQPDPLVALTMATQSLSDPEKATYMEEKHASDLCAVQNELFRYKQEPLKPPLDLVQYWEVCIFLSFRYFTDLWTCYKGCRIEIPLTLQGCP